MFWSVFNFLSLPYWVRVQIMGQSVQSSDCHKTAALKEEALQLADGFSKITRVGRTVARSFKEIHRINEKDIYPSKIQQVLQT